MDVEPDGIKVSIVEDRRGFWPVNEDGDAIPLEPGGEFELLPDGPRVSINRAELANPQSVAATFAHELAHYRLYAAKAVVGDEFDNELITDLASVHLGFGVFTANDPRNGPALYSVWPGTDLPMPRYMPSSMAVHVLALAAVRREERRPAWLGYLNQDAATNAEASLRYLRKTRDSRHLANVK